MKPAQLERPGVRGQRDRGVPPGLQACLHRPSTSEIREKPAPPVQLGQTGPKGSVDRPGTREFQAFPELPAAREVEGWRERRECEAREV